MIIGYVLHLFLYKEMKNLLFESRLRKAKKKICLIITM